MNGRLTLVILLGLVLIPLVPVAHAASNSTTTNVDIGIGADVVNLNVTAITSSGGAMRIWVNGVELHRSHNYGRDIFFLKHWIGGVEYNLVAYANYTDGRISMLMMNDGVLAGWVGCLNSTDPIGRRIYGGNSSVVVELSRLDSRDAELLRLVAELQSADSSLTQHIASVDEAHNVGESILWGMIHAQNATIQSMQTEEAGLRGRVSELEDAFFRLEVVLVGVFAVAALIAFAYWFYHRKALLRLPM